MKISTSELKKVIANLSLVAPRQSGTIPILWNVHIAVNKLESTAIFSVTDLKRLLRIRVNLLECAQQDAVFLADFRALKDLVTACKRPEIIINPGGSGEFAHVSDGVRTSLIRSGDIAQFPSFPTRPDSKPVILPIKKLTAAYRRALIAVSTEANRPVFTGISWSFAPEITASPGSVVFRIAATDGKKIIFHNLPISSDAYDNPEDLNHILPAQDARVLLRLKPFRRSNDTVALYFQESLVNIPARFCYVLDDIELYGSAIEGTYPDYMKAYLNPDDASYCLELNTAEIREQFKGLYRHCDSESGRVVFSWDDCDSAVLFTGADRETGEISFSLSAVVYAIHPERWGEYKKEISFNSRFVEQILSACEHDTVKIYVFTQKKVAVFDGNMLLMPLRMM